MTDKTLADVIFENKNAGTKGDVTVKTYLASAIATKTEIAALADVVVTDLAASTLATDFATQKTSLDAVITSLNSKITQLETAINAINAALKA